MEDDAVLPCDQDAPRSSRHVEVDDADLSELKSKYKTEYNLRTRTLVNRIKTEKRKTLPKQPKPKTSPAPLSKYRRRAANARERNRQEDMNLAFSRLKGVLPNIDEGPGSKMTKVTTLRLAMNYITALRDILGYDQEPSSSETNSDLNSDGDSTGTPSVSSGEDSCFSPESSDTDFLSMDFLENVNIDFETDPNKLLMDCT